MSQPVLKAVRLGKAAGLRPQLQSVSLSAEPGEVLGIVGPPGAGKNALLRVLTTLEPPDDGQLEICGIDALQEPHLARRKLGYLAPEPVTYSDVTVAEYLSFFAQLNCAQPARASAAVVELLQLGPWLEAAASELGQVRAQYLQLARALLHDPVVLILDEPTRGWQAQARADFHGVLTELSEVGKAVVLTGTPTEPWPGPCQRVALLDQGHVHAVVTAATLQDIAASTLAPQAALAASQTAQLRLFTEAAAREVTALPAPGVAGSLKIRVLERPQAACESLQGLAAVERCQLLEAAVIGVSYRGDERAVAELVAHLVQSGFAVTAVEHAPGAVQRLWAEWTKAP